MKEPLIEVTQNGQDKVDMIAAMATKASMAACAAEEAMKNGAQVMKDTGVFLGDHGALGFLS